MLLILSRPKYVNIAKWHSDSDRNVTAPLRGPVMG